jgi:hypothetical protein
MKKLIKSLSALTEQVKGVNFLRDWRIIVWWSEAISNWEQGKQNQEDYGKSLSLTLIFEISEKFYIRINMRMMS